MGEIREGIMSGLKSWLGFGTSVIKGRQPRKSVLSESDGGHPASRLRVMHRGSTTEPLTYDTEMGPPTKSSSSAKYYSRSARTADALANLAKGDDKQTRKAEEQVRQVS